MKKSIIKYLLMVVGLTMMFEAQAAPITREQARQRASQFLQSKSGSRMLSPVLSRAKLAPRRAPSTMGDTELYYVFNRGSRQGYVIVSGDDMTLPVLGYTDEGEFDYSQIPDNMRSWLDAYEQQLAALMENPITTQPRYAQTHDAIAPMVTTRWNQGSPYNDACPMYFTLGRSVTGCVATAMAQVLYFQRAKSVTEIQADIPAYETNTSHATYGKLSVEGIPAGSPIDWDNMLDTYGSGATAKQKQAVADLMHYCGVSVQMDYTNSGSGAYSSSVALALPKYFGYGSSVQYAAQHNYSDDAWDELLYNELANGRPFYLSGSSSSGGHAFVCDGYDGNRCFHINWGWGGSSDGFFLLTSLNPSSQGIGGSGDGYSQYQEAVIGFEPENYSERALPIANAIVKRLCLANFDADGDGVFTFGEAAAVTSLGEAFKGQRITEFSELYYFTSLKTINDDAFAGCTSLKTIRLPKALRSIGARAFERCTALKSISLPDGVSSIGEQAFSGCKSLKNPIFPVELTRIDAQAFENCLAFTELSLPESLVGIGAQAFAGCTKLTEVSVETLRPQDIVLGASVFSGVDVASATLSVVQGTKEFFETADQWKDFGNIAQKRNLAQGQFLPITVNKDIYIYNVGTGRYLTKGEAWGTQAVVDVTDEPMRFQLRRSSSMPDGVYYLYAVDTESSGHYLFRTTSDSKVGSGVKACFVDRSNLTADSYWQVSEVGENAYTLQVPANNAAYVEGEYLGVQPSHVSNAASPTYGIYSDISYADYSKNCQWMFVEYDAERTALYQEAKILGNLLTLANKKHVNCILEQAVYDDFGSTMESIRDAQKRLRRKLDFISFADNETYRLSVASFDVDGNNEISYSEAASVVILGTNFYGSSMTTFDELQYFTGLSNIYGSTFQDCKSLTSITLPQSLTTIYYKVFSGCSKLSSVSLPEFIATIDDNAFYGCTSLSEVYIYNPDPSSISLGSTVFGGIALSKVTLHVPAGSKALYAAAPVWKNFGTIVEMRGKSQAEPHALTTDEEFYVMNVGERRYLGKGEAWGTQSIAGTSGLKYQFHHTSSMPDGVYYLTSSDVGSSSKNVLFRTDSDKKLGEGVKGCFVDGSVSAKAYWKVTEVKPNVYMLQVPESDDSYVEGEYLGVDPEHQSDVIYPTYGAYYDVTGDATSDNCHWQLYAVSDIEKCQQHDTQFALLGQLLQRATQQSIDVAVEQAVYDDLSSTPEQVSGAIESLRTKLQYIQFTDEREGIICVQNWDADYDNELSKGEAAAVTDILTMFRSFTSIRGIDELRFFTGLRHIPDEAFYRCSGLISAYVPEGVTSIGVNAFGGCSSLKYIAVLNPTQVVAAAEAGLPSSITVFVPAAMVEAYQADAVWGQYTILPYTGIPTVVPNPDSRLYGRTNPKFTYSVVGAPINGEPVLSCEADVTTPVGTYPIVATTGENTSVGFTYVAGELKVEPYPLTITARSYTRNVGEPNPDFALTFRSFRNRETYEVLLQQPTVECDATPESPAGEYEIRVFGAEAQNYDISYVNGVLTVIDPDGVRGVEADTDTRQPVFDLSGRRVDTTKSSLRKGVYIVGKRKIAVR